MRVGRTVLFGLVAAALGASGCIAVAQGVGPIPPPGGFDDVHAAVAAGGGAGRGTIQTSVGAAFQAADWFAADLSLVVDGVYQQDNGALRDHQGLTVSWGLWPLLSGIFRVGPVDLRLSLFGIGGGGPEGPGGYMGYAGATLGLRLDDVRRLWAGFTAQAVYGCCDGEYSAVSYQVPVGFVFARAPLGESAGLAFAVEALWAREDLAADVGRRTVDSVSLLLHVLADYVER